MTLQNVRAIKRTMKTHFGFTLVELVIVLALAAIITALATPSFRAMIQNNRAASQANDFLSALNLARSEAIKHGRASALCARRDPPTNPESCSATPTDWSTGWLVFRDTDEDGAYTEDDNGNGTLCDPDEDCLLRVVEAPKGNPTFTQTSGSDMKFRGNGMAAVDLSDPAPAWTLTLPDCQGNEARTITMSRAGGAQVTTTNCP